MGIANREAHNAGKPTPSRSAFDLLSRMPPKRRSKPNSESEEKKRIEKSESSSLEDHSDLVESFMSQNLGTDSRETNRDPGSEDRPSRFGFSVGFVS